MVGNRIFCILVICSFLMNFSNQIEPAITSAIIGAVATTAAAGSTALKDELGKSNYNVKYGLEIQNWSNYPVKINSFINVGGYIDKQETSVEPGSHRTVMVARKTGDAATGTYGVLQFSIGNEEFTKMWSVPYSHNHDTNWLGLGKGKLSYKNIYDCKNNGIKCSEYEHCNSFWCYCEYSCDNSKRRSYYYEIKPLKWMGDKVSLEASMGNSHQTEGTLKIFPNNWEDFSLNILEKVL